ncbi:MAG: nucleoside hydrolase [Robiginitomaculum sp.]|nr:nucleoside hydrolase [Robiginitomaculum sp.]MDQ7077902.1 nucleoside hydrolase [Robiginitomaculum sp.]
MGHPILIDTDPGQDDALAILLALAAPEKLDVRGIIAVAGNVPLPLTQKNARRLVDLSGRDDVPVYAGCSRPMVRDLITAENVHGRTGVDGYDWPETKTPLQDQHGVDFIIDTLMAAGEGEITLCTLGPLTNIAMALVKAPQCARGIREIVMMGGGFFEGGNTTPAAEFNILVDPHAAHVVFNSALPLTLMPLDVTHKALATAYRIGDLAALGNETGRACAGMLSYFNRHDVEKYGAEGAPLHDPCVIAYLLKPELFSGKKIPVQIEISSGLTLGMTVMDWWGTTAEAPNCMVMNQIDADGYFDLLTAHLGRLP